VTQPLRAHLQVALARKVDTHGLVVWDDPASEYGREVAEAVCPPETRLVAFDGSWYELRRRLEADLAGERPPRLVVYAPADPPTSDPLAEVRAAAAPFKLRLDTLVRQALAGQLTDARLADIGRRARNLLEAEAAATGGDSADVRLISLLGTADATQMLVAVLAGEKDKAIGTAGAWDEVAGFLARVVGGRLAGRTGEELRQATVRHLVLTELAERRGGLPDQLSAAWSRPTADQSRRGLAVLDAWRRDRHRLTTYALLAAAVDEDLGLTRILAWDEALAAIDTVPAVESAALTEAVRHLQAGALEAARELAERRLETSLWARTPLDPPMMGAEVWGPRWRVVRSVAAVRAAVKDHAPPRGGVAALLSWYASSGWTVDREHRRLELALAELHVEGDLEEGIGVARAAYEEWLDGLLTHFTASAASEGVDPGELLSQTTVHDRFLRDGDEPVAYVWVDALRYELGEELADKLRLVSGDIELHPAVAAAPSITPVGMAALCPGAEDGLALALDGRNHLVVRVGGADVKDVPARVGLLRAAHGRVVDLQLSDVVSRGERELARRIKGASLVLVRSQEIDAQGESGMLSVTWDGFEAASQQLIRAIARLAQAGVRRVVVSADHGFVALSRGLRADRLVDSPTGGVGEVHARAWVGRGGIDTPAVVRVALSDAGVQSDLDLLVPAHLAVFRGPWTRQFFHGGLSPQELLVPVLVAETRSATDPAGRSVRIEVAGNKLTTGIFSATLELQPDLFASEADVRVQVRRPGGAEPIARAVAGDGYDSETGTVRLGERPAVLTFRLTANLERGEEVEATVVDARTDRPLGGTTVHADAPIVVQEDLL
jgi:hypothetical protein